MYVKLGTLITTVTTCTINYCMIGQYQCNFLNLYCIQFVPIEFSKTNKCGNAVEIKAAVDVKTTNSINN